MDLLQKVPYLRLYQKAVQRNPLYGDEKVSFALKISKVAFLNRAKLQVYAAYWQQEPQAIILAKKQYEYMKQGMSEDDAHQKAVEYVNALENDAFVELKSINASLRERGAQESFLNNENVALEVAKWREQLKTKSYHELDLADQGEIDHFIQTKILKWGEVDRERRMKEPVFVLQFEKLRQSLFPERDEVLEEQRAQMKEAVKRDWFTLHLIDKEKLTTLEPFYLEDYIAFLEKLKYKPDISKWSSQEVDRLTRWMTFSLAFPCLLEKGNAYEKQRYFDELRLHYFPMTHFPDLAAKFVVPTVNSLKVLLYHHAIGYKREQGKTYVRRFYRIPMLLFPEETFISQLQLQSDEERLRTILSSDSSALLSEMATAGLDESSLPEVRRQLQKYLKHSSIGMPNYGLNDATYGGPSSVNGSGSGLNLDSLLNDSFDVQEKSQHFLPHEMFHDTAAYTTTAGLKVAVTEKDAQAVQQLLESRKTELDKEKDLFYAQSEGSALQSVQTVADVEAFKQLRLESEIIARARMMNMYEEKESARRAMEWKRRGVVMDLPMPTNPLDRQSK